MSALWLCRKKEGTKSKWTDRLGALSVAAWEANHREEAAKCQRQMANIFTSCTSQHRQWMTIGHGHCGSFKQTIAHNLAVEHRQRQRHANLAWSPITAAAAHTPAIFMLIYASAKGSSADDGCDRVCHQETEQWTLNRRHHMLYVPTAGWRGMTSEKTDWDLGKQCTQTSLDEQFRLLLDKCTDLGSVLSFAFTGTLLGDYDEGNGEINDRTDDKVNKSKQ